MFVIVENSPTFVLGVSYLIVNDNICFRSIYLIVNDNIGFISIVFDCK